MLVTGEPSHSLVFTCVHQFVKISSAHCRYTLPSSPLSIEMGTEPTYWATEYFETQCFKTQLQTPDNHISKEAV